MEIDLKNNFLEEDYEDLKFLLVSNIRSKIIISLKKGPKKLSNIREDTEISSSTILHGISQLESRNLVSRSGESYLLTSIGNIISLKLINLIKYWHTINLFENFWKNHNINEIPVEFLRTLDVFSNAYIIESTKENIENPFTTYLEMIADLNEFKAILPIFFPRHLDAIQFMIKNERKVELILTDEIYNSLLQHFSKKEFTKSIKEGRFNLWKIDQPIKLASMFSDNFISLGLFLFNGEYDPSKLLLSHDKEAITWGKNLFEYYKEKSEKIDIKNL
ncbi:MAG: hypothetical protein CIT03_08870 [Methanobacterium sp.]|nr:MAG: hypothetical protein CIT03_08870 [Methanobacterium sp.]